MYKNRVKIFRTKFLVHTVKDHLVEFILQFSHRLRLLCTTKPYGIDFAFLILFKSCQKTPQRELVSEIYSEKHCNPIVYIWQKDTVREVQLPGPPKLVFSLEMDVQQGFDTCEEHMQKESTSGGGEATVVVAAAEDPALNNSQVSD